MANEESLKEITSELVDSVRKDISLIVTKELNEAKMEMAAKSKRFGLGVGLMVDGLYWLHFAFACLTLTLIAALAQQMDLWQAAGIVTLGYASIGSLMILLGKKKVGESAAPIPTTAISHAKERVEHIKEETLQAKSDVQEITHEKVDHIKHKVNVPARAKEAASHKAHEIQDAAPSSPKEAVQKVKKNPLPFAGLLAAAAAMVLLFKKRK